MRTVQIYAWLCPDTDAVVYVGKTSMAMSRRMTNHIGCARRHPKTRKEKWLAALLERGMKPTVEILETTTVEESSEAEKRWAKLFAQVAPLLNDERVGAGNPGVGRVEWTPEAISLLGKIADSRIAKMLGCERKTVSYKRECLGIEAAFDRTNNTPPPNNAGWNKLDLPTNIIEQLGKKPDYILAKEAGCQKKAIARARKEAGIKDYAATTGSNGRFRNDRPHPRWIKRAEQRQSSTLSPDTNFVTDDIWRAVSTLFPPAPKHGRRDHDDRAILRGVLWIFRSGMKWLDLPEELECGSGSGAFRRLCDWIEKGHWPPIEAVLRERLPEPDSFEWSRAKSPGRKRE